MPSAFCVLSYAVHVSLSGQGLARTIFYDDLVHTLLFAPYGTSSDDANVGKWQDVRTNSWAIVSHLGNSYFSLKVVRGFMLKGCVRN